MYKYDISDPKQMKDYFDKIYDPDAQIIWREIHKWQRDYRRENKITLSEFLRICEIDDLAANRQYFRPHGVKCRMSSRISSISRGIFNQLKTILNDEKPLLLIEKTATEMEILEDKFAESSDSDWYIESGIMFAKFKNPTPGYLHVEVGVNKSGISDSDIKMFLMGNLNCHIDSLDVFKWVPC